MAPLFATLMVEEAVPVASRPDKAPRVAPAKVKIVIDDVVIPRAVGRDHQTTPQNERRRRILILIDAALSP